MNVPQASEDTIDAFPLADQLRFWGWVASAQAGGDALQRALQAAANLADEVASLKARLEALEGAKP